MHWVVGMVRTVLGLRRPGLPALLVAGVCVLLASASCHAGPGDDELEEPVPASSGASIAAFGDSYSAGEGTNAYLPGTATPGVNVCHRSSLAYSQLLVTRYSIGVKTFAACSGAVTADMFGPNNNRNEEPDGSVEPAQLCQTVPDAGIQACGPGRPPALDENTTAVTLTIGGNDAGYAKVVESCVYGGVGRYRVGLPGRGCRYDPATITRALRRIAALAGHGQDTSPYGSTIHPIRSVLAAIHTVAPNARVYLAGYPTIFQPTTTNDCQVGAVTQATRVGQASDPTPRPGEAPPSSSPAAGIPLLVTAADARAVDDAIRTLNTTIAVSARAAGRWVTYVDPVPTFTGHGLCGPTPWLNPVRASVAFDTDGRSVAVATDPGSAHPDVDGQQGYATAFISAGFRGTG